jgi:uncharacterized protein YecT (DUF1311 family)
MMFHNEMADYFDFLNMHGFKRMHENAFLSDSKNVRVLDRYFINHYEKMPETGAKEAKTAISSGWYDVTRTETDENSKRRAIRNAFTAWLEFEEETCKALNSVYETLEDNADAAAAHVIEKMIHCIDKRLKRLKRLIDAAQDVNFDLSYLYLIQPKLHRKERKKADRMKFKIK